MHCRPVGFDVRAGEVVLKEGERLGPAELGLMATVGVISVEAYRRPCVAVLSTGNEVRRTMHAPWCCVLYIHSGRTVCVCV